MRKDKKNRDSAMKLPHLARSGLTRSARPRSRFCVSKAASLDVISYNI